MVTAMHILVEHDADPQDMQTVERGLDDAAFCSIAIVGDSPLMCSTLGRSSWPRNCRA